MTVSVGLLIIAICVLLEGFFSGSELALVSADKVMIRHLQDEGTRSGRLLGRFLEEPEPILTTTLIGTNLCVVTSATVFAVLLRTAWGHEEVELLSVLILSPAILLFGELLPKSLYRRRASRIAPVVIHPLSWLSFFLRPAIAVARFTSTRLSRLLGSEDARRNLVTREELRQLLEGRPSQEIEEDEAELIGRIFEFGEVTVREVMRPLIDVVAVERESLLRDALDKIRESGFSRLPVFAERVDDIVGVLWARDLLYASDLDRPVRDLARPVHYVPEVQKVAALLPNAALKRSGLAVVVDEYGGAEGIVTVEDILEEIVGEIQDEHDAPEDEIRRRGPREYRVSARVELDRLAEELDIEPPDSEYETLGGLLLERFGRIPRIGDEVEIDGLTFCVASASKRGVDEVDIRLPARPDPPRKPANTADS